LGTSSGETGNWWYPLTRSIFEKTVQPSNLFERSCKFGRGTCQGGYQVKMAVIATGPPWSIYWVPCAKGRPMVNYYDEWCLWILTFWIPLWQFLVFEDQDGGILQKWGGGYQFRKSR
jgi:hypothetical protein